jgi:hypothetical protein
MWVPKNRREFHHEARLMPPLYRMPVFYLAAIALAMTAGIATWARSLAQARESQQAGVAVTAGPDDPSPPPPALAPADALHAPPEKVDDGILRTADGLRRRS